MTATIVSGNNQTGIETPGTFTTGQLIYNAVPTAGNILVTFCSMDKDAGTITTPTGWTTIETHNGSGSISGGMAYKIAEGTEAEKTVTWNWTTAVEEYRMWVCEYSGIDTLDVSVQDESGGSVVNDQSTGTTAATSVGDSFAIAVFNADTSNKCNGGQTVDSGGSATGGSFTFLHSMQDDDFCGLSVATRQYTGTGTVEAEHHNTDTGDQMAGWMAVFNLASTGVTGTLAVTLDDTISAASGQVGLDATGTLAQTADDTTSAASGQVGLDITGSLAETADSTTSAASGQVGLDVTGTLVEALDDTSSAAAGQVGLDVTGSLAETLDDVVSAAVGQIGLDITGSLAETLDDTVSAASGTLTVIGTLVETLDDTVSAGVGVVGSVAVTGTIDVTLDDMTSLGVGVVEVSVTTLALTATIAQDLNLKATVAQDLQKDAIVSKNLTLPATLT